MGVPVTDEIQRRRERERESFWGTWTTRPNLTEFVEEPISFDEIFPNIPITSGREGDPSFLPFTPTESEASNRMYITTSRPVKEDFHPDVLERVRGFLREALNMKACSWPGYVCPIVINGVVCYTVSGSFYTKNDTKVFIGHDGIAAPPDWVPEVLNSIIEWFCLNDEEDFSRKALQLFAKNVANRAKSFQRSAAQAFNGQSVIEIAVNTSTHQLAGRYEDDPSGAWRLAYTGEEVDFDDEENRGKWFPLRMSANFLEAGG